MSDIQKKLEDYLNDKDKDDDFYPSDDIIMMDKMVEFIMSLGTESLDDEQVDELTGIIDTLADENLDETFDALDEAVSARKVKISPAEKRKRRMEYRKKRAQIKMKAKKFRKTTKYKQWSRMKKRRAGQGKTARGKRIRKFL